MYHEPYSFPKALKLTGKNDSSSGTTVKAGALMCPMCCVEYIEVKVDFEYDNVVLHDIAILRCPVCHEELFSPEQQAAFEELLQHKD